MRHALALGAVCASLGVLAFAWEQLARQAPSSAWHVTGFPAEIARLAERAWLYALALFALAPRAWNHDLARAPARARTLLVAAYTGALFSLGALAVSARTGLLGVQVRDATGFDRALLFAGLAGDLSLLAALWIAVRAAMRDEPA